MLTPETNELLTRTGAGTRMGELMRSLDADLFPWQKISVRFRQRTKAPVRTGGRPIKLPSVLEYVKGDNVLSEVDAYSG